MLCLFVPFWICNSYFLLAFLDYAIFLYKTFRLRTPRHILSKNCGMRHSPKLRHPGIYPCSTCPERSVPGKSPTRPGLSKQNTSFNQHVKIKLCLQDYKSVSNGTRDMQSGQHQPDNELLSGYSRGFGLLACMIRQLWEKRRSHDKKSSLRLASA